MRKTAEERFERKVDRTGECHLFLGAVDSGGYGTFTINKKPIRAHRFAYTVAFGPIPKGDGHHGICVLHKCDNRLCVRPEHLFLGSHSVNMKDMVDKGRNNRHFAGSSNPKAKLVESDVATIRSMYGTGNFTQSMLAAMYNITPTAVSCIVLGKTWVGVQ